MPILPNLLGKIPPFLIQIKAARMPHIHVRYSGMKAFIAIEDGRVLSGEIPAMQKIEAQLLGGAA